jgi:hydroxyacylglutathione hydrolase
VQWLLADQPEVPAYFAQMKKVNKQGAPLLRELPQAQHIREVPSDDIVPPDALFIDTRPLNNYAVRHLSGTVNIPISSNSFTTYVGYYVDYSKPTFFIAYETDVLDVLEALFSIGVDDVRGYFTEDVLAQATGTLDMISPQDAYDRNMTILDVRGASEYADEHIPGVLHIHMSDIPQRLSEIPQDKPVAVHCSSGMRSQVVTSLLQRAGYDRVYNMSAGIEGWKKAGLPLQEGAVEHG